jgi:hypothetical protein
MPELTRWPWHQLRDAPNEIDLLRIATSSGRSQPRDERASNGSGRTAGRGRQVGFCRAHQERRQRLAAACRVDRRRGGGVPPAGEACLGLSKVSDLLLWPTRAVDDAQRVEDEGPRRPSRLALATAATGVATCGVHGPRAGRVPAQSGETPDAGRDGARASPASGRPLSLRSRLSPFAGAAPQRIARPGPRSHANAARARSPRPGVPASTGRRGRSVSNPA